MINDHYLLARFDVEFHQFVAALFKTETGLNGEVNLLAQSHQIRLRLIDNGHIGGRCGLHRGIILFIVIRIATPTTVTARITALGVIIQDIPLDGLVLFLIRFEFRVKLENICEATEGILRLFLI